MPRASSSPAAGVASQRRALLPAGLHVAPFVCDSGTPVVLAIGPQSQLWGFAPIVHTLPAEGPRAWTADGHAGAPCGGPFPPDYFTRAPATADDAPARALTATGHPLLPAGVHAAPWRVGGAPVDAVELLAITAGHRLAARVVVSSDRDNDVADAARALAAVLDVVAEDEARDAADGSEATGYSDGYGLGIDDYDAGGEWKRDT